MIWVHDKEFRSYRGSKYSPVIGSVQLVMVLWFGYRSLRSVCYRISPKHSGSQWNIQKVGPGRNVLRVPGDWDHRSFLPFCLLAVTWLAAFSCHVLLLCCAVLPLAHGTRVMDWKLELNPNEPCSSLSVDLAQVFVKIMDSWLMHLGCNLKLRKEQASWLARCQFSLLLDRENNCPFFTELLEIKAKFSLHLQADPILAESLATEFSWKTRLSPWNA